MPNCPTTPKCCSIAAAAPAAPGKKGVSVLLVPPSRRRRAEEMLGRARVNAVWGNAPSADEIRKLDQERLLQNPLLTEPASDDDLAMADALLTQHEPAPVAAAFVKMYRAGLPAPEEIEDEPFTQRASASTRRATMSRAIRASTRRANASAPREHAPREHAPREHASRDQQRRSQPAARTRPRARRHGRMASGSG